MYIDRNQHIELSSTWVISLMILCAFCTSSCSKKSKSANKNPALIESDTSIQPSGSQYIASNAPIFPKLKALLASRYSSLSDLDKDVRLRYLTNTKDSLKGSNSKGVIMRYGNGKHELVSKLLTGVSQGEIQAARDGSIWKKAMLVFRCPYGVANRFDLKQIYLLARRRELIFGEGDVAFYDLAENSVDHILSDSNVFINPRDSSEKGYLNTFNHFTAQALITSIYSSEIADFIGDVHERHSMPQLMTGVFTHEQLNHVDLNPIDNYIDMINNELGQTMGNHLKRKYGINKTTYWTPSLLTNYLNDVQQYYSWSFDIRLKPFLVSDEVITRFTDKINLVVKNRVNYPN